MGQSLTTSQQYEIVDNDGTDAVVGHFAALYEGDTFSVGNRLYSISYRGVTGNDVVLTSHGALIVGTAGKDTINASTSPAGQLKATALSDKILGFGGSDKLSALAGNDTLQGGAGKDTIDGGKGRDTADYADKTKDVTVTLDGADAVSVKVGTKAEDSIRNIEDLVGGSGADRFTGDGKDNRLDGGLGKDVLRGNGGKDHFVFSTALVAANADTIADFKPKTDKLVLDAELVASFLGDALEKGEFYAKAGAKAANDSDDRIIYNKSNGKLYVDIDGKDGPATAVLLATLSNIPSDLKHTDFLIV